MNMEYLIKNFNTAVDQLLGDDSIIHDTLYHYRGTFDTLKNILEKREIWFTDYRCLNDFMEIRHLQKNFCGVLENRVNISTDQDEKRFLNELKKIFIDQDQHNIFGINYYISSFSEERDYLPLWRYYGKGVVRVGRVMQ